MLNKKSIWVIFAILAFLIGGGAIVVAKYLSKSSSKNIAETKDEYYGFASGGVSGRVNVIGLPSMRLLKTIEPFRDFGYQSSDIHEPVFSMQNGMPDGKKLYVQDKINNAVTEIDLETFRTSRVVKLPNVKGPHHIAITPDNKYIFTTGEFSGQVGVIDVDKFEVVKEIFTGDAQKLAKVKEAEKKGDYDSALSQARFGNVSRDLLSAGHEGHSGGSASCIDFNSATDYIAISMNGKYVLVTDRYVDENELSRLHIIDTDKLEVVKSISVGKASHGVDINRDGKYALVSNKLSGTLSVIDLEKLEKVKDIKVGNGPLHVVFSPDGKFAYVTLYLDNKIAEISMETLETTGRFANVSWSPGHLAITPDGKYIVSLNKESREKYPYIGLVAPENLQLIERVSMKVVKEMPIDPEPHNMKIIRVSDIKPSYASPVEFSHKPGVYKENGVAKVYMAVQQFRFDPQIVKVKRGEKVRFIVTNVDTGIDMSHGFALEDYGINLSIGPGETQEIEFTANKRGMFTFYCSIFCGALHLEMTGVLVVE